MNGSMTEQQFWTGIGVLIQNFHAVNRKIFACVLYKVFKVKRGILHFSEVNYSCLAQDISRYRNRGDEESVVETTEADVFSNLNAFGRSKAEFEECEGFILFYRCLSKKLQKNVEAIGVIDFSNKTYKCKFLSADWDDYFVKFGNGEASCGTYAENGGLDNRWAEFVLKPKLFKWCKGSKLRALNGDETTKQTKSLQLVDLESYHDLYKSLKCRYAEKALKCWNTAKESTDPLKFIYEDLAIAAYLISLWKRVGLPNGFADLGCGNGLLVYILSEEGYNGYGYDVRSRKIWSCYPSTTRLIEQTIEPQVFKLTQDVDWLIGNHSDELSPWISVLAATNGYHMKYFLLPCCAYELSGSKFQRRNTSKSVYQDFFAYLKNLSQNFGYATLEDRLKIPSTKRLALVGLERTHTLDVYDKKLEEITRFVEEERSKFGNSISGTGVKLRDRDEAVRNCTQIDKHIIDALVLKIFHKLLFTTNKMPRRNDGEGKRWQSGTTLRMCEIVKSLDRSDLQNIKAECGGIKTLLRNKHEIFEFLGEDYVGIRKPHVHVAAHTNGIMQTVKKRACFFHLYHPDGCPLSAEDCTFVH